MTREPSALLLEDLEYVYKCEVWPRSEGCALASMAVGRE